MPHPTPPHHQRSIKNLRLEKEAFRGLSFRSVGTNNYSFPVAFVHQRLTYNWGPTLYSFSVLFTSEIHDSFYGDFYGNLTVSY